MADACVCCEIVDGAEPSQPVAWDDRADAFMGIESATFGHLLVVPRYYRDDLVPPWRPGVAAADPADLAVVAAALRGRAQATND